MKKKRGKREKSTNFCKLIAHLRWPLEEGSKRWTIDADTIKETTKFQIKQMFPSTLLYLRYIAAPAKSCYAQL